MKTLTLCGSMRFERDMRAIAYELEAKRGYNVLQCVSVPPSTSPSAEDLQSLKRSHYAKIDLSDGIYVVNIDGYIGASVREEIHYAQTHGKEILYHCVGKTAKASPKESV